MATAATIPDTLPADFAGFDNPKAATRSGRTPSVPDRLPAGFDGFDKETVGAASSLRTPTLDELTTGQSPETQPLVSPEQRAASLGQTRLPLGPPKNFFVDTTQIPRNHLTNALEFQPPIATEEEKQKFGTIGPQPDVTLSGPFGVSIKVKQGDIDSLGKVFLPGLNPNASLGGNEPIIYPERGLIAPQNLLTEAEQRKHPILTGLGQLGEGLTTPENLAILAGTMGFGELPATARAALSTYFTAQMAQGANDYRVQGWQAYKRGDNAEAQRLWTLALGSTALGAASGAHALRESGLAPKVGPEPVVPKGTISRPVAIDEAVARGDRAAQINAQAQTGLENVDQAVQQAARSNAQTVGAGEATVPEKPETLNAQVDALAKGTNKVVYFPKGTASVPAPPENAKVTVVPGDKPGAGTYYHADEITPAQIKKAVNDGTYGELLGNVQTKEEAAQGQPAAVVARDEKGIEQKASVVDTSKPEAVHAQAQQLADQFPGAQIGIETPENVVAGRQALTPKQETSSRETPLSPQTQGIQTFPNASAESPASLEAIKRVRGEKQNGTQRLRIDTRTGNETPIIGPEAVDAKAGPYDRIVLRQPNGSETVLDEGAKAMVPKNTGTRSVPAQDEDSAVGVHDLGEIGPVENTRIPRTPPGKRSPVAQRFTPEVLDEARQELIAAHQLASSFEQPGRYFASVGQTDEPIPQRSQNSAKGIHLGGTWYGVSSSRHIVADQFPWYGEIEQGPTRIGKLIEKGKGAEYERLLGKVAESIQREKESAAPVIAEFAPRLRELSDKIDGNDQDLSDSLAQFANSDGRGFKNLRQYIEGRIADAEEAHKFYRLVDAAAAEARQTGAAESSESSGELRPGEGRRAPTGAEASATARTEGSESSKLPETSKATAGTETSQDLEQNALPGFESAIAEQKRGAAKVQAERLGEEANRPLGNIDQAAGEMERESPLFRNSEANPQGDMFAAKTEPKPLESTHPEPGDLVQITGGKLKGKTGKVTRFTEEGGVYVRTDENSRIRYVKAGDFEAQAAGHGPGTPLAGHLDTTGTRIEQLAQVIRENAKDTKPVTARIDMATKAAEKLAAGKDAVSRTIAGVKAVAGAMYDAIRRPAPWTAFDDALGKYQGAMQKSAFELRKFAKSITEAVPDKVRRQGIANFIEANGDEATLKEWAAKSKGSAKRGYEAALSLNDTEKTIARNIIASQDERLELDKQAGILEHEVENYVMHVWKRENSYTKKIVNNIQTQMLQPNPSFAKQRIFGTYFDGEQAGFTPLDKDVGFLFAAREHAANGAIAARALIRQLLDATVQDGRPLAAVSGSGKPIPEGENPTEAYLVDSKTKPEEIGDYRSIDHPALRKFTWATNTEGGEPIFVRGDIVIHPEVYGKLKNVLSKSALRTLTIPGTDIQPFRIAARLSSEFKNTLLSFSGFHQTQESLHAVFHKVNPFTTEPIDFTDPVQERLVDHGLQVASFDAQQEFGEGLSSGLTQRIPVIGKYFQRYNDYLFSDLIPRLKMTLAQEALQRNLKRYSGKLSEDQIYALTANQANAAFGELNYTQMARNKTFQDVLRMTLLAPDFLEARGRFVGQALKPYGKEQAYALMRGALGLYLGARVLNTILDKDPHWEAQNAFSVVYKGRSFTLRSVPGDIAHLFTDPRGFIYNRLNPIYGRGAIEAITGRNQYGRKVSPGEQAKDLVGGGIPIPFQGLRKSSESGPLETVLSSAGVSTAPYKSPAERLARQFTLDSLPLGEDTSDRREANRLARQYEDQLRKKQITPSDLAKARTEGKISASDQQKILARAARTPLQNAFRNLSPEQAIQVWDKANAEEREQVRPMLANKISRLGELPPDKASKLRAKILAALHPEQNQQGIPLRPPRQTSAPSVSER